MQSGNKADNQANRYRGQQRGDGLRVKAVAVPVFAFRSVIEQIVDRYLPAFNQIEINQQNAEQRPDKRSQYIRGVVDKLRS